MKKLTSLVVLMICFVAFSQAQTITGQWKTIDDETGEAKSYVTITEVDGVYIGKVSTILNKDRKDAKCTECSGEKKNKPILGLQIISGVEKVSDSKYTGGKILDPQNGKEYDVTLIPIGTDELEVKGGYKIFGKMMGRTQSWYRQK